MQVWRKARTATASERTSWRMTLCLSYHRRAIGQPIETMSKTSTSDARRGNGFSITSNNFDALRLGMSN